MRFRIQPLRKFYRAIVVAVASAAAVVFSVACAAPVRTSLSRSPDALQELTGSTRDWSWQLRLDPGTDGGVCLTFLKGNQSSDEDAPLDELPDSPRAVSCALPENSLNLLRGDDSVVGSERFVYGHANPSVDEVIVHLTDREISVEPVDGLFLVAYSPPARLRTIAASKRNIPVYFCWPPLGIDSDATYEVGLDCSEFDDSPAIEDRD